MAEVTPRQRYQNSVKNREFDKKFKEMEAKKTLNDKLSQVDGKMKDTMIQIEVARQELYRTRTVNKELQKKIADEETEVKNLHTKVGSLKVKLGLSNTTLYKGNDDKEKLRTNLNELQVEVARLEERHTAAAAELDRLRDPSNPESNMSIKKHVASDRKEIKSLKTDVESETSMLTVDKEMVDAKDNKIKVFEKELAKVKHMLKECENQRLDAESEEEFERKRKEEFIDELEALTIDKKSYNQRLKELKVKLGISVANQNVSKKFEMALKREEKSFAKQLNQLEKKLKDANGHLDVLKNQHKMSKTALSINQYTQRNQKRTGVEAGTSLAQSGKGPLSFGSSKSKSQPKPSASGSFKGSMGSIAEKSKPTDKQNVGPDGARTRQTKPSSTSLPDKSSNGRSVIPTNAATKNGKQKIGTRRESIATNNTDSSSKQGSNQLVPPRKPPLQKQTPR